ALPGREDLADLIPDTSLFSDNQEDSPIDVFFIHPTTYSGDRGHRHWNGSTDDQRLNKKTDEGSIKYQGSIFNGVGKVYAPRYRQAHIHSYFTKDTTSAGKAFELAYKDIAKAFQYYLEHYNQGRPIILAGHSQGAQHGFTLLREFFEGTKLLDQLVAAYIVGMPIPRCGLNTIPICQDELDIQCFCSWRTLKTGYTTQKTPQGPDYGITNPLNWSTLDTYAPDSLNLGGVLRKFEGGVLPGVTDAQIRNGVLWAAKPEFKGSIFLTFKNYHIADFNLYYSNVRLNAQQRAEQFLKEKAQN
ncbi:MAG: DUF3089 domain-containing protein, partial [Saprospiraceae bacterium]|nr:DUF3089 domain-containing protein [Saprospiraceae bacterium]